MLGILQSFLVEGRERLIQKNTGCFSTIEKHPVFWLGFTNEANNQLSTWMFLPSSTHRKVPGTRMTIRKTG